MAVGARPHAGWGDDAKCIHRGSGQYLFGIRSAWPGRSREN